jgi:hypothetical protein
MIRTLTTTTMPAAAVGGHIRSRAEVTLAMPCGQAQDRRSSGMFIAMGIDQ